VLVLFVFAALAYGAASFAYAADAGESGSGIRRHGRALLLLAAVLHLACIGAQGMDGHHPLFSVFHATSLGALIAVAGYIVLSRGGKLESLGAIISTVGLIGLILSVVFGGAGVERLPSTVVVARTHISLAALGVAGFTLAAGVAGLYLVRERNLRRKAFRPGQWSMSLTALDRLHHRLVLLVTPVFTLAIVTGVIWMLGAGGLDVLAGHVVQIVGATTAWLASLALLISRAAWGTRGRRSAWLTLLAFAAVVLVVVTYGVRA
jgi:ABC-type uncharacterized transport system permease subunit